MKNKTWLLLPAMAIAFALGAASARSASGEGAPAGASPAQVQATEQDATQERLTEREQLQREQQAGQIEQRQQLRSGNPPDDPGQGLKPGTGNKDAAAESEIREGPYGDRQKPKKSGTPRH